MIHLRNIFASAKAPSHSGRVRGDSLSRKMALLLLMLSLSSTVWAQQNVLTGKVTEYFAGEQEPVVGANVVFVNSQNRYLNGAVTDLEGNFRLQVPADNRNLSIRI